MLRKGIPALELAIYVQSSVKHPNCEWQLKVSWSNYLATLMACEKDTVSVRVPHVKPIYPTHDRLRGTTIGHCPLSFIFKQP